LILTKGLKSLHQIIDTERIAGKNSDKIVEYGRDLAKAIKHMHDKDTIHADIKPRNVIRASDGDIKLIDLDASVEVGSPLTKKKKSTAFISPEVARIEFKPEETLEVVNKKLKEKRNKRNEVEGMKEHREMVKLLNEEINELQGKMEILEENEGCNSSITTPSNQENFSLDIWGFGVTMYPLFTNKETLFLSHPADDTLNGKGEELRLVNWKGPSTKDLNKILPKCDDLSLKDTAKDFFKQCLHKDVNERFQSMNDVLGHALFKRTDALIEKVKEVVDEIKEGVDKTNKMIISLLQDQDSPRLPYMIPQKWEANINTLFTKKMKIAFICPVSLTVPRNLDGTVKGYDITLQRGWVKKYGPALLISLEALKVLCAVGRVAGLPLPNLNSFGTTTNIIHVANDQLIECMEKEDITAKVNNIGSALNNRVTVGAGISLQDYSEAELKSFVNIKRLAEKQDDPNFLNTGLVKVVRVKDGKVEYILNDPYVINEYKEGRLDTNDPNPISLTLAQGVLEKQDGNTWNSRYLVLNRFGFLSCYHTKDKFDDDKGQVKGKMKKIVKIEKAGTDLILKVTYYDDDERTFRAADNEEKEKWIDAMSS